MVYDQKCPKERKGAETTVFRPKGHTTLFRSSNSTGEASTVLTGVFRSAEPRLALAGCWRSVPVKFTVYIATKSALHVAPAYIRTRRNDVARYGSDDGNICWLDRAGRYRVDTFVAGPCILRSATNRCKSGLNTLIPASQALEHGDHRLRPGAFGRLKLLDPEPDIEVRVFSLTSFLRRSLASLCALSRSALFLVRISGRFCDP